MSKIYIKQKFQDYFVYKQRDEPPFLKGYWSRNKGLHSDFYNLENEPMLNVRTGKCPWIGGPTSYLLNLKDYPIIEVELKSRWKPHYDFYIKKDHYILYEHSGHKRSLYKNGNQVAKFDKVVFNWGERDSGFVIYNSDENIFLILGLWIMKDMGKSNDPESSNDLGNLTPGPKEWNEYWIPTK